MRESALPIPKEWNRSSWRIAERKPVAVTVERKRIQTWWTKSKDRGRLSVCRHADAAEEAFRQVKVHQNILDVPFKTYQRGTDG
jgi:hypothetical protein